MLSNVYLMQNMKKILLKCQFLCFFRILDLSWPKCWLKGHTYFPFFADFQWNMLGDSINMNNLCLKKLVKALKNCFSGPDLNKNGVLICHTQNEKQFFDRNNKSRSSVFKNVLFYQNIICFDWVIDFFLSWEWRFCQKKCHFQLKQLCRA